MQINNTVPYFLENYRPEVEFLEKYYAKFAPHFDEYYKYHRPQRLPGTWHRKKLVKMVLQKLPHGDWFAHTSSNNFSFYEQCGFEVKDVHSHGTCAYYDYIEARKAGHR